jgi:hypothetical protein
MGSYSSNTSDSHSVKVSIPPKSTPSLSVVSQQQSGSMGSYSSNTSDSDSVKVSIPPKSTPSLIVVSQQQCGSMGSYSSNTSDSRSVKVSNNRCQNNMKTLNMYGRDC